MAKYKASNLVVLSYAPNACFTRLTEFPFPEEIEVNLENGTWTYKEKRYNNHGRQEFKIGTETRHCAYDERFGVIGIYDRTSIVHLRVMIGDSRCATADRPSWSDD